MFTVFIVLNLLLEFKSYHSPCCTITNFFEMTAILTKCNLLVYLVENLLDKFYLIEFHAVFDFKGH